MVDSVWKFLKISGYNPIKKALQITRSETSMQELLMVVSNQYNVSCDDLKGKCRSETFVKPRHIFCYVAKTLNARRSWTEIAKFLSNRNHSTIMAAFEKIDYMVNGDLKHIRENVLLKKEISEIISVIDRNGI